NKTGTGTSKTRSHKQNGDRHLEDSEPVPILLPYLGLLLGPSGQVCLPLRLALRGPRGSELLEDVALDGLIFRLLSPARITARSDECQAEDQAERDQRSANLRHESHKFAPPRIWLVPKNESQVNDKIMTEQDDSEVQCRAEPTLG